MCGGSGWQNAQLSVYSTEDSFSIRCNVVMSGHVAFRVLTAADCMLQLQKEAHEKEETYQRMVDAEKRVDELEDENKQLRKDFSDIKRELDKLRKEVSLCCMSAA